MPLTTSPSLASVTIAFHAATLIPLAVALQKFGDRSEMFLKSLAGVSDALASLRRQVAAELERDLAEALQRSTSATQASPILNSTGQQIAGFSQHPVNFPASEAFRTCIHEFAGRHESALRGYVRLIELRDRWAHSAAVISWCVLAALTWEVIAFAGVGAASGLLNMQCPDWVLLGSYAPTAVVALVFLAAFARLLLSHDRILDIRRAQDAL
jgi:hypothetical protein